MLNYKIIDLNNYPRIAHLEYFMSMECPQLQLTADVDVTALKAFCKREGCSFFLSFLHVAALSAESIPQLRQRIHRLSPEELEMPEHAGARRDGFLKGIEVREYAECPTSHTEATGDELYCYCSIRHHSPWKEYIAKAEELQKIARESGTLDEDDEVEAFFFPTCIPWVHYKNVVHPMTDRFDSNPRISWGKFEEDFRGRLMMPVSLAVHHGLVDGIHVGRFYENIQKNMELLIEGKL